jgi:hypothetical protein
MDAPEAVHKELRPLLDVLYDVFEKAVAKTISYLQGTMLELHGTANECPPDPYVFSQLVRFHASELLDSQRASDLGFLLRRLPNSGIFLEYRGYQIRVWKADEGQLPAPGNSQAKQDFYQQEFFADIRPRKLAVLWESFINGEVSLILACPKGEGDPWEIGQSHWEISVPHPAQALISAEALAQNVDDFEDLEPVHKTGKRGS